MTHALFAWLGLTLTLAAFALASVYRLRGASVAAFILAACAAYPLLQVPLSYPAHGEPPKGEYTILGARIDIDEAIYVLLDGGDGEPRYWRLPYTAWRAESLQNALNAAEGNGGVEMSVGDGGETEFHPPPVAADEAKRADTPMMEVE